MAGMTVKVDMSELIAAEERARDILAMFDEIEGRFADLYEVGLGSIVASAPTSPPPPKPRR